MITLKEQSGAVGSRFRFLVGERRMRARQIPVFESEVSEKVVTHQESIADQVTVFHVLGYGRTPEQAVAMAKARPNADSFFWPANLGCSPRFEADNNGNGIEVEF